MKIRGVLPPVPTPLRDDAIDLDAMRYNVDRWMATRVNGIVVLGSNGEAPLLDETESDEVIAAVRECVPEERLLLVGTGRESTRAAAAAARRAGALGADAVLVRTPSYFKKQLTVEAFVAHYTTVAEASPVPVVLYNFTALTGVTLPIEAVSRLAEHPNIIGMKESGSDLRFVATLVDHTPDDFSILAGSAPAFYASLLVGAVGGVLALACVVPDLCVELYELVQANRHREARELQRRLTPLADLVTSRNGVPGLKSAVSLVGFTAGDPRPPMQPVSAEVVFQLRQALEELEVVVPE